MPKRDSAEDPSIANVPVLDGNGKTEGKKGKEEGDEDWIGEETEKERERERCGTGGRVTRGFASLTNSFIPGGSALVRHNPSICRRGVSRVMLLLAASCRL